jgi:hypothetical protein
VDRDETVCHIGGGSVPALQLLSRAYVIWEAAVLRGAPGGPTVAAAAGSNDALWRGSVLLAKVQLGQGDETEQDNDDEDAIGDGLGGPGGPLASVLNMQHADVKRLTSRHGRVVALKASLSELYLVFHRTELVPMDGSQDTVSPELEAPSAATDAGGGGGSGTGVGAGAGAGADAAGAGADAGADADAAGAGAGACAGACDRACTGTGACTGDGGSDDALAHALWAGVEASRHAVKRAPAPPTIRHFESKLLSRNKWAFNARVNGMYHVSAALGYHGAATALDFGRVLILAGTEVQLPAEVRAVGGSEMAEW